MPYLLLLLMPFVMSIATFLLRRAQTITIALGVATLLLQALLVLQIPADAPVRLLGMTIALDSLGRLFLLVFLAVVSAALLAALGLPHGENFVSVTLLLIGFVGATLLFLQEPFIVALLLVSASISGVLAIVDLPTNSPALVGRQAIATGLRYLVIVVIAGVMTYLASVLASIIPSLEGSTVSAARLVLGLLVVGFGLRLAIVPFHAWLPDLIADAAPMVSVVVVAVVNLASLLVLLATFQFSPQVVLENGQGLVILQWLGALTAVIGALLALGQRDLRRLIGYLIVYDTGVLLCGVASVTALGLAGALLQALSQTTLIFALLLAVALLERPDDRPPNVLRRDLLRRWPLAGAGLICAIIALIGLPPFGGFVAKLLVYQAVGQQNPVLLAVLLAAAGICLLALGRVLRERLIGPSEDWPGPSEPVLLGTTELDRPAERRLAGEPRGLALLLLLMLGVQLAVGLYPQPLVDLVNTALRSLTFVRAL